MVEDKRFDDNQVRISSKGIDDPHLVMEHISTIVQNVARVRTKGERFIIDCDKGGITMNLVPESGLWNSQTGEQVSELGYKMLENRAIVDR